MADMDSLNVAVTIGLTILTPVASLTGVVATTDKIIFGSHDARTGSCFWQLGGDFPHRCAFITQQSGYHGWIGCCWSVTIFHPLRVTLHDAAGSHEAGNIGASGLTRC
jgi:hypothetical protein